MTLNYRRLLASSTLALFFCVTSCSSPDNASADGSTADDGSMTQGGAQGQGVPQEVDDTRRELLTERYLEAADRLRRQGTQAGLEAAQLELLKARDLSPSDQRVKRMLEVVAAELNLPNGTAEDFAEVMARTQKVHEERRRAEVQAILEQGEQALAQNNYERAIQDFKRAILNIEVGNYIQWGSIETQARDNLEKSLAKRDEAERQQTEAARARSTAERRAQEAQEQTRKQAQIDGLMAQASKAFQGRQFKLSQDIAFRVMNLDPNNHDAKNLHNAAIKAARDSRTDKYYRDMVRQLRQMEQERMEMRVTQNDLLFVDQDVWDNAKRRQPRGPSAAVLDPENEALRENLAATTISGLTFTEEDGTFDEVVSRVRTITAIPMIITSDATETIDGEDLRLVMELTAPISVDNFLDQMVSTSEELAWTVEDGVVKITTKASAGGANYLDQKDVRDLVAPKTVFLPPLIQDLPTEREDDVPTTGGEGEDPTYFVELDTLVANIKDATDPEYWDSEGGGVIDQAESGYLLVTANPEMQRRVDRVLDDLRRFATTVVTIESKFLSINQAFLQEIGVDFRGTGGGGNAGNAVQLDDVTNGLDDNASRGLDNSGTQDPAASPFAGAFYNDGGDGDVRGRTENFFTSALGRALSPTGGATAAIVSLDDLQMQMIVRAVEKNQNVQVVNGQNLTVLNNERGHVAIINQTAYVSDYNVEVAQAAFIADPIVDVIQDGIVLDVRPTVSYDRKRITLDMQPTVADLIQPIPTFSTSLAGTTQPVTLQLPQLFVRSFATTIDVPDGGSVLVGGLRELYAKERRAQVPILADIPLLSFFFKQEGVSDENRQLMVLVRANITDVRDVMANR